jgi:hypothetical protein
MLNDELKRVELVKGSYPNKKTREWELEQVDLASRRKGKYTVNITASRYLMIHLDIQEAICEGDIPSATNQLREHFPHLPYSETPSTSASSSPTLTPRSRYLPLPSFSTWPTEPCIPVGEKAGINVNDKLPTTSYGFSYPSHQNLDPTVIKCQLKLQGLVEEARTVPLSALSQIHRGQSTSLTSQPITTTPKDPSEPKPVPRSFQATRTRRPLLLTKAESISHTIRGVSDFTTQSELLDQLEDAMRALSNDRPESILVPRSIPKPVTHSTSLVNSIIGVHEDSGPFKLRKQDLSRIRSVLYRPWSELVDHDEYDERIIQVCDWLGYTHRTELAEVLDQSILHSLEASPTPFVAMLALQTSMVFSYIYHLQLRWSSQMHWLGKGIDPLQRVELEEWDSVTSKEKVQVGKAI